LPNVYANKQVEKIVQKELWGTLALEKYSDYIFDWKPCRIVL